MRDPLVTVCMPTLGRLRYLGEAQRSLEQQTLTDREVLVLDNAAPPDAQEVLGAWAAKHDDVRILRTEERLPVYANFNRGIRAARGRYVTFFHDDDRYHPDFLRLMVELMERTPGAAVGGCNYDVIDSDGRLVEQRRPFARTEAWSGRRFVRAVMSTGRCPLPMQGVIYRRSALGDGFDATAETHFGDFALLMRLAEQSGQVAARAETLLEMRKHVGAASSIPYSRALPIRRKVLEGYLREIARRSPDAGAWVTQLEVRHALAHRASAFYGWATADEAAEARACAGLLGERWPDRLARAVLIALADLRLRPTRASRLARDLLTR